MGLLEDLGDQSNFVKPQRAWCATCTIIKHLSEEEQKALLLIMNNPNVTHQAIVDVLVKNGHEISSGSLGRHRRGICSGVAK